jgi:hypothetical protein
MDLDKSCTWRSDLGSKAQNCCDARGRISPQFFAGLPVPERCIRPAIGLKRNLLQFPMYS